MMGCKVLVKDVAQAILAYCISILLMTISLSEEIQHMINSFW